MQLGMVGLGRMGANIVRRLMNDGHECVVYDVNADAVTALAGEGATGAESFADMASKLEAPRAIWLMIPAGLTGDVVDQVAEVLEPGDIIIDGGNSNYRDDVRRAAKLKPKGIHYVDAGTSGGVFGLERGYCLMVGGPNEAFDRIEPILKTIAPGKGDIERTPGRTGDYAPEELGYLHCGPSGAGHFVKMVHNGIEYGIMAALAEGMNILKNADAGVREAEHSAEIAPLEEPEFYQFTIDTPKVAELWRRGSVISSWLLDLTAAALEENPTLDGLAGRVSDSGEGRWTVKAAVDTGVPAPVLSAALFERFASRDEDHYANQLLSAMRLQFGGHHELPTGDVLEAGARKSDQAG
ncbi:MAG: decarboxylating 6-phosphogluconate dehydrogenase [Actinobacteria bacterium]|jgi:6-phosphogluconate dehydrogenase|uniref:phosphogluconate dehydrogenase (NAD(+)-dependent, decarboxylating) n=2 Tax=Microbacteriaceae TaxID=85023 RepID=UPI000C3757C7|nr:MULTISPECIES: decarboxylating 6-phosphogluconate dehydrogenase [Microbacterium]RUA27730.1 MAG: decarboxylating 6-phosphogluconate dehydrogenase [Actinomycetota bacterium]MBU20490.1 6-phosphogluconate dehydrogenase (decarboxylating) [Microbacterium sp.]MCC4267512.1 decarboxylating 6-phosphogluconate dehydrogenase [Microbacterium schleiferi]HAM12796.1 decarboxylating 6-phosphogluconate dehydrogenase [Microbacterium sp.]HCM49160.1 decarboxylating 6-phosphogluconate dehydrogenase [Microbacteriu